MLTFVLAALMQEPTLDTDMVRTAGRVIGIELTDSELEMMLADVTEHLDDYTKLRAPRIDNAVPPAGTFSPLLPGMTPRDLSRVEYRAPDPAGAAPERPADLESLVFLSIPELGRHLRAGTVTCVELAETYLDRLERLDAELLCTITPLRERALTQAARLDAELADGRDRGPLHGIPWGAKDLLAVRGARTTWGAKPYEGQVLDVDATVVTRLDEAGAVLIAKLSLGALAWGDVWFGGQTKSPWNTRVGSSGSSAGPSAATAAGCVAFAIGSETLGSIISPSVRCGNSSLRPTFGRVSRTGCMALAWSMDKIGPICRSLEDAALVFDAIQGPDGLDASVVRAPHATYSGPAVCAGLRIGYDPDWFPDDEAIRGVLADLEALGAKLVRFELPDYPVDSIGIVLGAEAATAFDELTRSGRDDELVRQVRRAWPNVFRTARLIPAVEYLRAQRLRTELMRDMDAAMAGVDVLVHPPYAGSILTLTNLTGHPTVIAPYGEHKNGRMAGAPYSVCFTGHLFEEQLLLGVAVAWQSSEAHHLRHPSLPAKAADAPAGTGGDR